MTDGGDDDLAVAATIILSALNDKRGTPQNFSFPYNISATAGACDFKFGAQLGFAKAHHKITRRRKGGRGPGLGKLSEIWGSSIIFLQRLGLATSNLVHNLGLPKPTIKPHPEQ